MELAATSLLCLGIFALFAFVYCGIWAFKILRFFHREMWRPLWQWLLVGLVAVIAGLGFVALTNQAWAGGAAGKDTFWFFPVFVIELFVLYAMSMYEHNLDKRHTVFDVRVNEDMKRKLMLLEAEEEKQQAKAEETDE